MIARKRHLGEIPLDDYLEIIHRERAQRVIDRGTCLPAGRDHAKLMVEQQDRRDAMRNARKTAPKPVPKPRRRVQPEDLIPWMFLLFLCALALLVPK